MTRAGADAAGGGMSAEGGRQIDCWRDKMIDDMTVDELRVALKQLGTMYTRLLEERIGMHERKREGK